MPTVESLESILISSPSGMSAIYLEKGVPRNVCQNLTNLALAQGAQLVGQPEGLPKTPDSQPEPVEDDADTVNLDDPIDDIPGLDLKPNTDDKEPQNDRADQILDAVKLIYQTGDTKALTVGGDPRVRPLEELLGFDITSEERDTAVDAYRESESD
jgi:hypothetical protein